MARMGCRLPGVLLLAMAMARPGCPAQTPASEVAAVWTVSQTVSQTVPQREGATAGPRPRVEPIVSMRDAPTTVSSTPQRKRSYNFSITSADWTDTGVTVAGGEMADFTASGSYSLGDGRTAGPEGVDRGWKDLLRVFPLNSAKVGEVVGRVSDVGASVPFAVGSRSSITFPTSGRLFLRVNVSSDLDATGSYKVQLKFGDTASTSARTAPVGENTPISAILTPETFADIPRRVSDQSQHDGDMVNYALLGTEAQVLAAFKAAGWVAVDKTVQDAVLHGLLSTLNHDAYTEMPMSTLYLFGRPQDLSFARGDPLKVAAERHHLRVWQTDKSVGGMPLWVGSCTHDIGFEKDQRNGGVTHKIDPKIDDERDYLLQSFDASGSFRSAAYVTPADPLTTARTATGGTFYSDGRILVMELRPLPAN